jgi:hypothetical protein
MSNIEILWSKNHGLTQLVQHEQILIYSATAVKVHHSGISSTPVTRPGKRHSGYRHIASTSFTVTNRLDLGSEYHTLILDVHTGSETFRIYIFYQLLRRVGVPGG